jgi:hypothetical protein
MPERRRIGTGGNITRSGLTAHWDMRHRRSSALPAIGKGSLGILTYDYVMLFKLSLRPPISSGPKNGEQPTRRSAMREYAVAPIQYRGVALRHVGPRDATWVPLSISTRTASSALCLCARDRSRGGNQQRCIKTKINLYEQFYGRNRETPEDHLLLQVQGVVAEYERANILERSRRGRLHAARQRKISVLASSAPYGYRYVSKQEAGGQARGYGLEARATHRGTRCKPRSELDLVLERHFLTDLS